jgi:hypothetical protein
MAGSGFSEVLRSVEARSRSLEKGRTMGTREINVKEVPGVQVVLSRLTSIDPGLAISAAAYDFDRTSYILVLTGQGREGRVTLSRELLDDVRDNRTPLGSRYSQELHARLTDALREAIESNGLISFSEKALKYKLLRFIYEETKRREHVEKYNTIGRDGAGDFERWLRITLTREEKETFIWIWGELIRLRLITPTAKDLVVPDNWVRVTDKGIAAIEGKSYVEYDEQEVFIAKGEVYTAYRTLKKIMDQSQTELLVIDPYVDEDLLDIFASLNPTVKIRLLTEHPKGNFKIAYRKLQQQRGGIEARCSSQFHDRFIVVDRHACYQLGGSINYAGAKATTIGIKSDAIRDRVIAEAESAWSSGTPIS